MHDIAKSIGAPALTRTWTQMTPHSLSERFNIALPHPLQLLVEFFHKEQMCLRIFYDSSSTIMRSGTGFWQEVLAHSISFIHPTGSIRLRPVKFLHPYLHVGKGTGHPLKSSCFLSEVSWHAEVLELPFTETKGQKHPNTIILFEGVSSANKLFLKSILNVFRHK